MRIQKYAWTGPNKPGVDAEDAVDWKLIYILPTNLVILLSHFPLFHNVKTVAKLSLGQGETKKKKLAGVVHAVQTTHKLAISRCCFLEEGKEMNQ